MDKFQLVFFSQDSNIGIPDVEGKTPLHWAASSRDSEAVNCVKTILVSTKWKFFDTIYQIQVKTRDRYTEIQFSFIHVYGDLLHVDMKWQESLFFF